ncbi:MAG: nucleotide sugar dehydrogenase [Proteobacteria bacterium]|nr:nucleotide sugar dehydrogenase [Pseudomonadota bacterium]
MKNKLCSKVVAREAVVGIIGLGYVGLPLAREFLKEGFKVCGFDVDLHKVEKIKSGQSYIKHIQDDFLKKHVLETKQLTATSDFARLADVDYILVCVPTPLGKHRNPDLSYVLNSTRSIARHLRTGHVVVLESSTYPGTTEDDMMPILEATGLKVGVDYYLGYSPEREDPGNKDFSTGTIPKIVSGVTPDCLEVVDCLYREIVTTIRVAKPKVAEASKILENTYRAVNIAMVNELKMLFDRMGINVWDVIEAAKSKPFGFQAFYPGPGLGGHCIPIDPFYLTWKAKEYEFATRFIELAGEINTQQPYFVVQKAGEVLNHHKKALRGSRILLLGVAYKKDIDDVRESPALVLHELLVHQGACVDYLDPYIPETGPHRHFPDMKLRSIAYSPAAIASYDLVLVVTDHSSFPYDEILLNARLILDTRNVYRHAHEKVFKA